MAYRDYHSKEFSATYDFAVHGGALGFVALQNIIQPGFSPHSASIHVSGAMVSGGGGLATMQFGTAAEFITVGTGINGLAINATLNFATQDRITAQGPFGVTIALDIITAGVCVFYCQYIQIEGAD